MRMVNAWDVQTGVKGRVIKTRRQSDASIRRILNADPQVQTLRSDSAGIGEYQQSIPATHARRNTAKCGTITVRRKTRKPRQ